MPQPVTKQRVIVEKQDFDRRPFPFDTRCPKEAGAKDDYDLGRSLFYEAGIVTR